MFLLFSFIFDSSGGFSRPSQPAGPYLSNAGGHRPEHQLIYLYLRCLHISQDLFQAETKCLVVCFTSSSIAPGTQLTHIFSNDTSQVSGPLRGCRFPVQSLRRETPGYTTACYEAHRFGPLLARDSEGNSHHFTRPTRAGNELDVYLPDRHYR